MSQFRNNFAQILQSRMDKRFQSPSTWAEVADPDNQQPLKPEFAKSEFAALPGQAIEPQWFGEGRRVVHANYIQIVHWPVLPDPPEGFDPDIQKLLHEAFLKICEAYMIPESGWGSPPARLHTGTFYGPQPNKLSKKDEPTSDDPTP